MTNKPKPINACLFKLATLVIALMCCCQIAMAQTGSPTPNTMQDATQQAVNKVLDQSIKADYTRAGFTLILLTDRSQAYYQDIEAAFKQITIPAKYDNNVIQTNILERTPGFTISPNPDALVGMLTQWKVPQQIVGHLFGEKNGLYGYDKLYERARYGLDDNAVMRLKQSAQGVEGNAKTDAWILPLLANTYIAVVDVRNVRNWNAYYDEIDNRRREIARRQGTVFVPVKRERNGFDVDASGAVMRLNLRDTTLYAFFDRYWADANTPAAKAKGQIAARSFMKLPMQQVVYFNSKSSNGFVKSYDELRSPGDGVRNVVNDVMSNAVSSLTDLRAKQAVYDIKPLRAKLGTKDGLHTDDLYSVYENEQRSDGSTVPAWRGYVRASVGVVDNQSNATGSTIPSEFYQVAGKPLDIGMIMQEEPSAKASVMIGVSNNGITSGLIRFELLARGFGSSNKFWNNSRLYLDASISGKSFDTTFKELVAKENTSTTGPLSTLKKSSTGVTILSFGLGGVKYFNFWRNVQAGPYLGLRGDYAMFSNNDLHEAAKADFGEIYGLKGITIDAGVRAGVVLYRGIRLMGSVGIAPYFTNSAFFGTKKPNGLGTTVTGRRVDFDNIAQITAYNDLGTTNPFYIRYDWARYDLGIHFEF
jgi:hypothetical protein